MINKKLFIACPISTYLTKEGIDKQFEAFIKDIIQFCRLHFSEVYIALEREEFGKKKMYGKDCTIPDYETIKNFDILLAIPEDSMGVSIEMGWASALGKEVIVLLDKKFKQSELCKSINCITSGIAINIDSSDGYDLQKKDIYNALEKYFEKAF